MLVEDIYPLVSNTTNSHRGFFTSRAHFVYALPVHSRSPTPFTMATPVNNNQSNYGTRANALQCPKIVIVEDSDDEDAASTSTRAPDISTISNMSLLSALFVHTSDELFQGEEEEYSDNETEGWTVAVLNLDFFFSFAVKRSSSFQRLLSVVF
jgi:hypothetical protein